MFLFDFWQCIGPLLKLKFGIKFKPEGMQILNLCGFLNFGWVTERMNGWPGRMNLEYSKVKGQEMEGVEDPEGDCVNKSTSVPESLCFRFSLTSLAVST